MSLYDYDQSKRIEMQGYPFYALVMAAYRQADTDNREALRLAFPDTVRELERRYNAPAGMLPEER